MLNKLFYIAVFVSDQAKALDYYTNVLGFETRVDAATADGQRFVTVGIGTQDASLLLWPGTPGRGNASHGMVPAQYTIETDNCRAAFETLQSRGVTFTPPHVLEFPWGLLAKFEDADGNVLQLREARSATV